MYIVVNANKWSLSIGSEINLCQGFQNHQTEQADKLPIKNENAIRHSLIDPPVLKRYH